MRSVISICLKSTRPSRWLPRNLSET